MSAQCAKEGRKSFISDEIADLFSNKIAAYLIRNIYSTRHLFIFLDFYYVN